MAREIRYQAVLESNEEKSYQMVDDTYITYEEKYLDAMRDYLHATTDQERDTALMLALWALTNLEDKIEHLRAELVVTS